MRRRFLINILLPLSFFPKNTAPTISRLWRSGIRFAFQGREDIRAVEKGERSSYGHKERIQHIEIKELVDLSHRDRINGTGHGIHGGRADLTARLNERN
ncbi:hypothetical protein RND71_040501 [Anisodus tanguticus]|uniref:Secreted protein n=1 Tax=Anisodus tanguticus TaxID=243964 RepID=A0AAE1UVU5_9SOLA|nr:hypothetical protein RND71_040501 [Anisodus tanguticus]